MPQPFLDLVTSLLQQFARDSRGVIPWPCRARILLLPHRDTVYERGMLAQQPFRVERGSRLRRLRRRRRR
jgi:hypothetical protein